MSFFIWFIWLHEQQRFSYDDSMFILGFGCLSSSEKFGRFSTRHEIGLSNSLLNQWLYYLRSKDIEASYPVSNG